MSVADKPLVSILAANYNCAQYVESTLNSIRHQTYANLEVIIIDDASTDDSVQIIEKWMMENDTDKSFRLIVHKSNTGVCKTCNDLIQEAKGKYVSFIATDDIMLPDKISSQVEVMENSLASVAIVYSDVFLMDETGLRVDGTYMHTRCALPATINPSGNIIKELQEENFLHFLGALVRKDVYEEIGPYDETLKFEDYDMALRIAKKYEVLFIDNIQVVYRIHANSFSGKTTDWQTLLLPLYLKHIDLPLFKIKAEEAIVENYFQKRHVAKQQASKYYELTGEHVKYSFFITNGFSPLCVRLLKKFN